MFDNKVPFTLVFYLLDSGQDQIINSALEETIKEFLGFKAFFFVDIYFRICIANMFR